MNNTTTNLTTTTDDDELFKLADVLLVVVGCLACFSSLLIILTGLIFPSMLVGKRFFHYIFMISTCEFIASLFTAFGFPVSELVCSLQGGFTIFFYRSSWFFTTLLSFELYFVVTFERFIKLTLLRMHALTWGIGLSLELVIFSTNNWYGSGVSRHDDFYHDDLPHLPHG